MKRKLLLIILTLLPIVANAYNAYIDGIYYNLSGEEAEVTYKNNDYISYSGAVIIPESITYNGKNYTVTSIGNSAFRRCYSLTSVTIPNTMTSIGEEAFSGCSSLTSINIPNSVTSIGNDAFKSCGNLTTVTLGNNALVSATRTSYTSMKTLFGEQVEKYVLTDYVKTIGDYAFSHCSRLTSVIIGKSVKSIGLQAFSQCTNLTEVIISESVNSIASDAFAETAWYNNQLDGLVYAGKVVYSYKGTMPSGSQISITEGTLGIAEYAFSRCSGLTSITIPNSVTSIGRGAFYKCSSLRSVNIPEFLTNIDDYTFDGCSSLTSITIPNSVTIIGEHAFASCYRLETINCLNPTPPFCVSSSTFILSSENITVNMFHSGFDIYTYAILHVPSGSYEAYSRAYEWRYFNRIKEDIEIDGTVYYANLTVMQGTTGYTRQAVKADERYTFFIGTINDCQINAISFNGVDVTDELVNGYYTTPEIKGESVLSISYDISPDAIDELQGQSNVRVIGYSDEITVNNVEEAVDVFVYTVDGKLIDSRPSVVGSVSISVPQNQMYVVKVDKRTYKIAL